MTNKTASSLLYWLNYVLLIGSAIGMLSYPYHFNKGLFIILTIIFITFYSNIYSLMKRLKGEEIYFALTIHCSFLLFTCLLLALVATNNVEKLVGSIGSIFFLIRWLGSFCNLVEATGWYQNLERADILPIDKSRGF